MSRKRSIGWALLLAASCLAATLVWADSSDDEAAPKRRQDRMGHGAQQPLHPQMRARMRAHDARLDELVGAMNASEGDAKVEAIAAVVNELVAQRRTRRDHIDERWKRRGSRSGEQAEKTKAP